MADASETQTENVDASEGSKQSDATTAQTLTPAYRA